MKITLVKYPSDLWNTIWKRGMTNVLIDIFTSIIGPYESPQEVLIRFLWTLCVWPILLFNNSSNLLNKIVKNDRYFSSMFSLFIEIPLIYLNYGISKWAKNEILHQHSFSSLNFGMEHDGLKHYFSCIWSSWGNINNIFSFVLSGFS